MICASDAVGYDRRRPALVWLSNAQLDAEYDNDSK